MAREVTHVNPKFGRRQWVKLWVNEWLDGTTRFEMTDAQRAFWIDLLAMAGRSRFPGRICAGISPDGAYIGYPINKFQSLMAEPIDVPQTLDLFERTKKVALTVTTEQPTRLVMIEILNWHKYQSEYQRQKKYRGKLQGSDSTSYKASDSKGNTTEVEGEVEGEEKKQTPSEFSKSLVETFTLQQKHYEWGAAKCPTVSLDDELEAWKDRMRAAKYRLSGGKGALVSDPQAAFYTSCRNAEAWGTYKRSGKPAPKSNPRRPKISEADELFGRRS